MAEGSAIGGFLGKTTANLPNWAWGLAILAGAGVGFFFLKSNQTSMNASTAVATPVTDTSGQPGVNNAPVDLSGGQSPVLTVPSPNGDIPILPTGYIPIKDSSGAIIGWEPPPANGGTQTTAGFVNPLIPYDHFNPHYFPVHPGHVFSYQGVNYWITSDTGGKIMGVPGATSAAAAKMSPTQVLLYAPSSFYH